jgi:hypothetical protein
MRTALILTAALLLLTAAQADAKDNEKSQGNSTDDGRGAWLNGERKGQLQMALDGKTVASAGNGQLKQDYRAIDECGDCDPSYYNTREAYDLNNFEKANTLEHWGGARSQKENGLSDELQ